jgi:hypothetical protein
MILRFTDRTIWLFRGGVAVVLTVVGALVWWRCSR